MTHLCAPFCISAAHRIEVMNTDAAFSINFWVTVALVQLRRHNCLFPRLSLFPRLRLRLSQKSQDLWWCHRVGADVPDVVTVTKISYLKKSAIKSYAVTSLKPTSERSTLLRTQVVVFSRFNVLPWSRQRDTGGKVCVWMYSIMSPWWCISVTASIIIMLMHNNGTCF